MARTVESKDPFPVGPVPQGKRTGHRIAEPGNDRWAWAEKQLYDEYVHVCTSINRNAGYCMEADRLIRKLPDPLTHHAGQAKTLDDVALVVALKVPEVSE